MRAHLMDSLVWTYPDSVIGLKPVRRLALDVARGGTGAAVILLNGLVPDAPVRLTARQSGPGRPARFFRLLDVPVEANTGPVGFAERGQDKNPFVTRRAPFRVYDAMQPVAGDAFRPAAPTQAVRVHIPVPEDARPGRISCRLTVRQGRESLDLDLGLQVFRARIPPVGRDSWPYTNWFSLENMAKRHRLAPWSAAHWAMIARYARLMARNRQNTFLLPFKDIFSAGPAGLALDRGRLRRLVGLFTRAGLYYIEGGHFGRRSTAAWTCPTFNVSLTGVAATSEEGNRVIAGAARQLMEEIDARGWRGRYLQHVADEPIKDNAQDYRIFAGIVRKYMPGIPLVDALMDPTLSGSVDIWCPQAQHYQKERARFDALRAQGDRLWFYTCCYPGGPWLNRLLDMELLRPVLLGWGAARFGLDGFLHWGLNQYRSDQDPFAMSVVPNWGGGPAALPPGDTHVVYPGADGPWSSVRFEAQREGLEDLELLRQLRRRQPRRAAALLKPVIRGFDDYTQEVPVLRRARRALLCSL